MNKFASSDGVPDEEQIEAWVEMYFFNLFNLFNVFFSQVEAKEAVSRMSIIPFEKLLREELKKESEETIEIALRKLKELVETEMQIMRAYVD